MGPGTGEAEVDRWTAPDRRRVLFLCTHNSAQSQMAEGWLRALGSGRFDIASAGTEATRVHPLTVPVMAEAGIDIASHTSKSLDGLVGDRWDYVITVCDQAAGRCPVFGRATTRIHWSVPDPLAVEASEAEQLAAFRRVRDEIEARVRDWLSRQRANRRPALGLLFGVVVVLALAGLIGVLVRPITGPPARSETPVRVPTAASWIEYGLTSGPSCH